MAQISVYLFLKADGEDVVGEPTVSTMGDDDVSASIECVGYSEGVQVGFDPRSGGAQGDRTYDPITITKWVDKASPVLAKAATQSQNCEGEFKFYRPVSDGGGWEHYFSVSFSDGRVQRLHRRVSEGEDSAPLREEVSFVFSNITWQHILGSTEHEDNWKERKKA